MTDRNDSDLQDLEGQLIGGRYRVAQVVAVGANTLIARAADERSQRLVTVKIVRPVLSETPNFHTRFGRVAEISSAITHPNIASVLDWGPVEIAGRQTAFWVDDYLAGGSLRDLFDRGRLLQPSQALVAGLEACRALDAAHQKGLVHTEITPSKLVFGEDRRLRIVDFGMARLLGEPAWQDPAGVPTHVARYASPEQALGLPIDATTDVYALSLCLIEAVTGSVPFSADSTVATLAARVGKLMPVSADLGSLAAVLERAGRPEPEDRFSAAAFGRALVDAAPKLPRPEPIPILTAGLFDTSQLRRPTDPTGGLARPDVDADGDPGATAPPIGGAGAAGAAGAAAVVHELAGETDPGPSPTVDDPPPAGGVAAAGPDPVSTADGVATASGTPSNATGAPTPVATHDAAGGRTAPAPTGGLRAVGGGAPLIVLADVADPPSGAVEVGAAGAAIESRSGIASRRDVTEQMPVEATPAGAPTEVVAATTAAGPVGRDDGASVLYDDERRPRRVGKLLLLLLVVLAGAAAATYAGYLLMRTKSYEVPDLVGVSEAVARNEVAGNGWEIATTHERSDEIRGIGDVIRTEPVAGVMLDEGESILFVVSDGPELRSLPEVDGLTLADAQSQLEELELDWIVGEASFHEEVPIDSVISWRVQNDASLGPGGQVLPGTVVVLTPSMGPEPRVVPALGNLTLEEASTELASRRLRIERGEDVFSDDVPAGRVVSQAPAPESVVERESTVTVRLSKGPDVVELPDIVGRRYERATELLAERGFTVGAVLGTTEGTIQSVTIDGEAVSPGDVFRRGTAVDLVSL